MSAEWQWTPSCACRSPNRLPTRPPSPSLCPASYHGSYYGGSRAGGSHAGSHGGSYHGGTGGAWPIALLQLPEAEPAAMAPGAAVCSALLTNSDLPTPAGAFYGDSSSYHGSSYHGELLGSPPAAAVLRLAGGSQHWHPAQHGRSAAQLQALTCLCLAGALHAPAMRCRRNAAFRPTTTISFFPPAAGGSYYEPSGKGGFGSARSRERDAKPKKPAAEAGGGLGAKLRRLFCFG